MSVHRAQRRSKDNLVGQPDPDLLSDRVPGSVIGVQSSALLPQWCSTGCVPRRDRAPNTISDAPDPKLPTYTYPRAVLESLPPSAPRVELQPDNRSSDLPEARLPIAAAIPLDCSTIRHQLQQTEVWDSALAAIGTECEEVRSQFGYLAKQCLHTRSLLLPKLDTKLGQPQQGGWIQIGWRKASTVSALQSTNQKISHLKIDRAIGC